MKRDYPSSFKFRETLTFLCLNPRSRDEIDTLLKSTSRGNESKKTKAKEAKEEEFQGILGARLSILKITRGYMIRNSFLPESELFNVII